MYQELVAVAGISTGSSVAGTLRNLADQLLEVSVGADSYDVEHDFNDGSIVVSSYISADETWLRNFPLCLANLDAHYAVHGTDIASTITTLDTFMSYYSGGAGGALYANLLDPYFADLLLFVGGTILTPTNVYGKGIHPSLDATATLGMGTKDTAGTFTAGASYNALYSEFVPVIEVITNFAGGGAAPAISIAGTNNLGAADTWTVTLDSNNPVSALATTITPAVSIMARQTVAVGSVSGMCVGSVLTVNAGLVDQEVIVVEAIIVTTITAVFRKAHTAGAALTGVRSYATTPSAATNRLRTVTGITLTLSGHAAGKVRVSGRQDRVAV